MTWQFFRASDPEGNFFEKNNKNFFRYGLEECVNQITGLYRFSFGQEVLYNPQAYSQLKI